ncbi:hypothetical protein HYFRA_00005406 [Hymenoscyphus fraxineus]|uniref:Uncharacterized protein n=1 Tax=Hymenoscyphus fraxineus TaxID=746836 RepID=A0A9N9PLW2_9HELO|nr:hypothetical protein HYFRA_00005406 [Hymenoscyphus fraxineus]
MKLIQVFSYLLLIYTSLSLRIIIPENSEPSDTLSDRSLFRPLSKRWGFRLKGFPVEWTHRGKGLALPAAQVSRSITEQDMSDCIDQLITTAKYIVENVKADDATFIQFFGTPKNHPYVMNVFSRIMNMRTASKKGFDELHIVADMTEPPQIRDGGGDTSDTWAHYIWIQGVPTIVFFRQLKKMPDLFEMKIGNTYRGQLARFSASIQGTLWHEFMHFVGDRFLYDPIVPGTWRYIGQHHGGEILDSRVANAAGRGEKKWLAQKMFGINNKKKSNVEKAIAYGESNCLLLTQLKNGPNYAIHNAESYTLFAIDKNANSNTLSIIIELE